MVFFIPALFQTFKYSFSKVDADTFSTSFTGVSNFIHAFQGDEKFLPLLLDIVVSNLRNIPLILIFSYLVAMLLQKPFKCMGVVKAIFFMTVILSSDMFIAMQIELGAINLAQKTKMRLMGQPS